MAVSPEDRIELALARIETAAAQRPTVDRITDDRVANVGEMHADLMRASRFEAHAQARFACRHRDDRRHVMPAFTVLTVNTHKGFTQFNRRFILPELREAVRSTGADLVFLQEVLGEHDRHASRYDNWPQTSQYEFLADSMWPQFAYGRNAVNPRGHHATSALLHAFNAATLFIALRMLTDGEQEPDDTLIEQRIHAAIAFREYGEAALWRAYDALSCPTLLLPPGERAIQA